MTRETFQNYMAMMAEMWPDKVPSAKAVEVYWLVLQELHDSVFEAAVAGCLKSCTFYPKPAEIIAKAREVLGSSGVLPAAAEDAWAEVLAAMRQYHPDLGWLGEVEPQLRLAGGPCPLSSVAEQTVAAIGGMSRIWSASDHELGFIHKEFLSAYEAAKRRAAGSDSGLLTMPLPNRRLLGKAKDAA